MDYGFKGKTAYIYGLGSTGKTAAHALIDNGVDVLCWDDKTASDEKILPLCEPSRIPWHELGGIIKSPGVPMTAPLILEAIKRKVPVISDLDLLWRRERKNRTQFIGITGTNGKSTTTALVGHVLRAAGKRVAVGGNIGNAALGLPELPDGGIFVLEFSSYQLEMTRELQVDGGILLNLTPDHLERHGTMENYLVTKWNMFDLAKPGAVKVLGIDQPILKERAEFPGITTVSVGGKGGVEVRDGGVWQNGERVLELADFTYLPGPHNAQNIACAYALLVPRWVSREEFIAGAKSFKGLPHRLEKVGVVGHVTFVNDSKATNGDSSVYALQSYQHIYWICGGKPKSDGLGACVAHLGAVRAAFTIGESGDDFAAVLEGQNVPVFRCKVLDKAVTEAFSAARAEGFEDAVVLLSPAAASLDQFRNFEHRGDVFANCVRSLTSPLDPLAASGRKRGRS